MPVFLTTTDPDFETAFAGLVARDSAMAAIQDDDLVRRFRCLRERHHITERQSVIAVPAIACTKVAAGRVDVPMAGEIQESDLGRVCEQCLDGVSQRPPGDQVVSAGGGQHLRCREIRCSVSISGQNAGYRICITHTSAERGEVVIVIDANDKSLAHVRLTGSQVDTP